MNPGCVTCGQPLRPTHTTTSVKVETPNVLGGMDFTTKDVREPDGHFGYQGSDLFCSLRCGFAWACSTLRRGAPVPAAPSPEDDAYEFVAKDRRNLVHQLSVALIMNGRRISRGIYHVTVKRVGKAET